MKKCRQFQRKKNLELRARIIQALRFFFVEREYLEVETPIRIPAPAPEAHIDAVATDDWYLQTSPELCMKQLLAAGFSRIFQLGKCFRDRERGARHLPELTMLEWYRTGGNYLDLMEECEDLICSITLQMNRDHKLRYQGQQIRLDKPWDRMTVGAAFDFFSTISMDTALAAGRYDEVMVSEIEPNLGASRPLFLYDYPASRGALARLKPNNHMLAERFELYIAGVELCNGFSELNDPAEQRTRFEKEQWLRKSLGKDAYPMPHKFLMSLEDIPDACGNALGIDRLVMLFANAKKIDDVVAFTPEEL